MTIMHIALPFIFSAINFIKVEGVNCFKLVHPSVHLTSIHICYMSHLSVFMSFLEPFILILKCGI